jgi:hypothetical protein
MAVNERMFWDDVPRVEQFEYLTRAQKQLLRRRVDTSIETLYKSKNLKAGETLFYADLSEADLHVCETQLMKHVPATRALANHTLNKGLKARYVPYRH